MTAPNLETERLILRQWKQSDIPLFAKINSDPDVMEFFPSLLSEKESTEIAHKIIKELENKPYGFWAVEVKNKASFIGFIGLHSPNFHTTFTPCIEIGWRLAKDFWEQGYALEGAKKVLDYAFNTLKLKEIVSFTSEKNYRSLSVMKRLNMQYCPENNFDHPYIAKEDPLCKHLFYKIEKKAYLNSI